ncbi:MAG: LLM class flavin-dependent oxidoreductase [Nitrososphaeraceae archaeon]
MESDKPNKHIKKTIGYWVAQEQYPMQDLLKFVIEAEKSGFRTTMTSDHFHPWWHNGGYSNFAWIWIAVAANMTKKMQFITGVTAPTYRYHPAIIAQAFASLDTLFPNRIGLGIGTGEAMNEVPLGYDWPSPKFRLKKTIDAIKVIKNLWEPHGLVHKFIDKKEINSNNYEQKENSNYYSHSESFKPNTKKQNQFLTYNGDYFHIRNAKLYTPPVTNIPIYMAASGVQSIKAAAKHTEGLITVLSPEETKEKNVFQIFEDAVKKEGKNPNQMEKIVEYKVSYSNDYDKAFQSATFWRSTLIENIFNLSIESPLKLQQKAINDVSDEKIKKSIQITTSLEDIIKSIEEFFKVGYTRIYIHSTSPNEIEFVREIGKKVLSYFYTKM